MYEVQPTFLGIEFDLLLDLLTVIGYAIGVGAAYRHYELGRGQFVAYLLGLLVGTFLIITAAGILLSIAGTGAMMLGVILIMLASSVACGMIFSARSINAGKEKSYAWFCLIPIANIYFILALLFIGQREDDSTEYDPRHDESTRSVFD